MRLLPATSYIYSNYTLRDWGNYHGVGPWIHCKTDWTKFPLPPMLQSPVLTESPWFQARFLFVSVGQILYPTVLKDVSIALPSMHSYSRKWLEGHWERIGGIVNININLWWPSMILP